MKSLALLFSALLINFAAFSQNGIYLFGQLNNSPGYEVEVSVEIFSTPPTTTSITVPSNGQIPITWISLPAGYWPSLIATFQDCDSTLNTHIVYNDSLNNLIDVYLNLDYCEIQEIYGCTDPQAINYDPNATINDGSCILDNGSCIEVNLDVYCIDTTSTAYEVTILNDTFCCTNAWDQICQDAYVTNGGQPLDECADEAIYGCTDPTAINYNPEATDDDGSCTYVNDGCVGIDTTLYCIDVNSIAYETTIQNDPFCCDTQWDQVCQNAYVELGGLPLPGCEGVGILGCTDPAAINYNPNATLDDGSCQYTDSCNANSVEILIVSGQWGSEMSWNLYHDGVEIAGDGEYQDNSTYLYELCLENGCYSFEMYDSFGDGWNGGTFSVQMNGGTIAYGTLTDGQFGFVDFGVNAAGCDSLNYVYGCTDPNAINYNPNATHNDGSCEYDSDVENDLCADATELQLGTQPISNMGAFNNENIWGECWAFGSGEGEQTSIWYSFTTPNEPATIHIEASGDGTNTLTDTQFGLFEECGGEMIYCDGNAGQGLFSAFHFECGELEENTTYILMIDGYFGDIGTCNLTYDVSTFCDILGCTDPGAINYNPEATINDGSCEYETECTPITLVLDGPSDGQGFFDIYSNNGTTLNGVYAGSDQTYEWCLEDGCYDMFFVMGNGGMLGDEVYYTIFQEDSIIGGGTFVNQTSMIQFGINSACDSADVYGCTDPAALNYNPNATTDDGSCEYEENCTDVTFSFSSAGDIQGFIDIYNGFNYEIGALYPGGSFALTTCLEDGCYDMFVAIGNGGTMDTVAYSIAIADSTIANGILIQSTTQVSFGVNTVCDTIFGCTDPLAINFDPNATYDDGSCQYDDEDCVEVGDDFCVDIDSEAYFITITQDSFCCNTAWDQICQDAYIGFGGQLDEDCDVYGCTDPNADNFNPDATIDDGSCEYEFECAISFTVSPDTTGAQVIWITPSNNIYNAVTVEWDFGDGNTSNALFPIHTYEGDGPYMLCLTAMFEDNGEFCEITYCAELTDEMINPPGMQTEGFSINVVDPTGTTNVVEQQAIGNLVLWPNPANDVVQIQYALNQSTNLMLDVYNSIGKQVRSTNVAGHNGSNQFSLDVTNLTPGMYIIRLTGNNEQRTERLIVR